MAGMDDDADISAIAAEARNPAVPAGAGDPAGDADISAVAAVIGNPARGRMLTALLGDRALPATELARVAKVAPSTASEHLTRLTDAGLVRVERHGRHRYHRLAGDQVAHAVEALAALAPPQPIRSLSASTQAAAERAARSCYDHLAGALGVALTERMCELGALDRASLALLDAEPFRALGVDVPALRPGRRPLTRWCLDWSERRPHLAGALGAATLESLLASGWVTRRPRGRALAVTPEGRDRLRAGIGLEIVASPPASSAPA
jgi:DNA-binding transcriptional ArsR family regulator